MNVLKIHEAKTHLSTVLRRIETTGERFVISRNGRPIADLVPHRETVDRLSPHPIMRKIQINYDPTEPLDPLEWEQEP